MKIRNLILLFFIVPGIASAQGRTKTFLDGGGWSFALDPVKVGEKEQWFKADFPFSKFDKVTVPHSFSVDPRYAFFTGTAWYFKKFNSPEIKPGYRTVVRFDAVFYKARVWFNGRMLGEHEGGYTPFELDITNDMKAENSIAIQVNNAWDTTTIPGAKTFSNSETPNAAQVFPWINYGGLTRSVYLLSRPQVFLQKVKLVANPDLTKGNATIKMTALVRNLSSQPVSPIVTANVYYKNVKTSVRFKPAQASVSENATSEVVFENMLPAKEVKLWNQDQPELYRSEIIVGEDTVQTDFGIRSIQCVGTKLLLNGEPVRMGGCNRPLDYPGFGSLDPEDILIKDLALIKNGCMELSRISHYPVSEALLNWADKNGLLIIAEAGNWQMTPKQMTDPLMRAKFQSQLTEMVERDWNHPSVIAWSMGNEFQSQMEEGKSWVKDMSAFTKKLDASRLITFASMMVGRDIIKKPEDEASQYVDFISTNIYGNHLKMLRHIHELYPGKPVFVSEFGLRTDGVKREEDRVTHLQKAMLDFRQCDFLIGASVWTFNDYQSRFPGTNANGYRPWGLVSPEREIRGMYTAWQEEFAPATIELLQRKDQKAVFKVTARADFPSYILRNYKVRVGEKLVALNVLKPGESQQVIVDMENANTEVSLVKPGGFVVMTKHF
ncbi:MAG: glycoside hydrolase family 2 TIM barrel-domain containing protein [Chitinophagaceae bacterium]